MEQWRRWRAGLMVLAVLAVASACTDDANPDGSDASDTSTTTTTVDLPEQDLAIDIEAGRVLFHQWDDDGTSRQLAMVTSDGGGEVVELAVDTYEGVLAPTVSSAGQVAALAWDPGQNEQTTTVLVGDPETGFEVLYTDPDLVFHCLRWLPDSTGLLATAFDGDQVDPVLLSLDLDGNATELDVPSGRYECAVPLADGRIVLTYTGEGIDLVAMAVATPGSDELDVLHRKVGCLLYGPSLSWTRPELVVAASCEEPEDSGIHIVDIETGQADHILAAEVAYPTFSPSGDWVTFGLFPSPDSLKSTIWAATRQGEGLREITDQVGATPAWVAAAS